MKKILFLTPQRVYLPEVSAYLEYFNSQNEFIAVSETKDNKSVDISKYDVLWEFKGFRGVKQNGNQILIHEYPSLSTGRNYKVKNFIKSKFDYRPDMRVFLNHYVKSKLNFSDDKPYVFRDMGVDEIFFEARNIEYKKEYDFVYIGSMDKSRELFKLLQNFVGTERTILLIGEPDIDLYKSFKDYNNIIFTGRVTYNSVPRLASKASYGINYIPNVHPFNLQTSTKLLEYLALGLKVVTTDYEWVRKFENDYNNNFFYMDNNKLDFNLIDNYEFQSYLPKEDFLWRNILHQSNFKKKIIGLLDNKI